MNKLVPTITALAIKLTCVAYHSIHLSLFYLPHSKLRTMHGYPTNKDESLTDQKPRPHGQPSDGPLLPNRSTGYAGTRNEHANDISQFYADLNGFTIYDGVFSTNSGFSSGSIPYTTDNQRSGDTHQSYLSNASNLIITGGNFMCVGGGIYGNTGSQSQIGVAIQPPFQPAPPPFMPDMRWAPSNGNHTSSGESTDNEALTEAERMIRKTFFQGARNVNIEGGTFRMQNGETFVVQSERTSEMPAPPPYERFPGDGLSMAAQQPISTFSSSTHEKTPSSSSGPDKLPESSVSACVLEEEDDDDE